MLGKKPTIGWETLFGYGEDTFLDKAKLSLKNAGERFSSDKGISKEVIFKELGEKTSCR